MRAIPLARAARRRHGLEPIVGQAGTLDAADATAARRIAARLTAARGASGEPAVSAGEVAALAALDATLHRLIEVERAAGRADLSAAVTAVDSALGSTALTELDDAWRGQFREGGGSRRRKLGHEPGPELLAEMLVLNALNEDPAANDVRELVDDRSLRDLHAVRGRRPDDRGRARWLGRSRAWRPALHRQGGRRSPAAAGPPARADAPGAGVARRAAALGPRALARADRGRSHARAPDRPGPGRARGGGARDGAARRRRPLRWPDRRRDARLPRPGLGGRQLLARHRVDAARRAHGQVDVRLARAARGDVTNGP